MTLRGENHTSGGSLRVLIRCYLFFATLFYFAQRLRCASAIFFLPAADIVLFFGALGNVDVRGRPPRLVEALPARRERMGLQACNLGVNG
jgi:hypothetical protein